MAYRDITKDFTSAASKLRTGQLVKDESFTLFEAVGALEIMDSKMDSGYVGPGEDYEKAIGDHYDVIRELSPSEVLGVMDQLLSHEMAWQMGHPLSQTLFTSLYLDKLLWPVPRTLDDARFWRGVGPEKANLETDSPMTHSILRAYCLALVKSCDLVHVRITSEYYYEEEDFVAQLYNRNLLAEFDVDSILRILDQAQSRVQEADATLPADLKQAILVRLSFRKHFLCALEQDIGIIQSRSKEAFENCLQIIPALEKSHSLGTVIPEAFSHNIQRKLASTVPLRPVVSINMKATIDMLRRICQDAIDIHELLDFDSTYNARVSIWTLMSRRPQPSVYIRCLMQTLITSDMKVLGAIPVKQFLYDDLAELVLPGSRLLQPEDEEVEVPSDPRFQLAKNMDGFVKRVAQPFVDSFRTACLNRCRIRRSLCHSIIEWDSLQVEAEELDEYLRTLTAEPPLVLKSGDPTYAYPLSSWVYHEKLRQLELIVQLGFELAIYSPEEYPGMYWYLSHLCSTHISHIERIRMFVITARKRAFNPSSALNNTNDNVSKRKQAFAQTIAVLDRHITLLLATEAFALALHALYTLLLRNNLIHSASANSPYSSKRLRYELRMRPFMPITLPEPVPFDAFDREASLASDSDAAVLERATAAVAEARRAWEAVLAQGAFLAPHDPTNNSNTEKKPAIIDEWQRDVKNTLRSCIATSIALGTFRKSFEANSRASKLSTSAAPSTTTTTNSESTLPLKVEVPEIGSSARWHDWWTVPRITETKS